MAGAESIDRTVTEVLEESWRLFTENIALFLLSGLIHAVLSVVTLGIMAGPLTVGFVDQVRRRRAGELVEVTDIFRGNAQFIPALVAVILIALGVALGLVLLILPGIYLALYWFCTLVVMAYEGTGALESMSRSGKIFKDNMLLVLVLAVLAAILNSLGGTVMLGTLLTSPFTLIMLAVFYEKIAGSFASMEAEGVEVAAGPSQS